MYVFIYLLILFYFISDSMASRQFHRALEYGDGEADAGKV
jgi:hypothetical protein